MVQLGTFSLALDEDIYITVDFGAFKGQINLTSYIQFEETHKFSLESDEEYTAHCLGPLKGWIIGQVPELVPLADKLNIWVLGKFRRMFSQALVNYYENLNVLGEEKKSTESTAS